MSSTRNDGKNLERVVALVEGTKLPEGFRVEKNSRVIDKDGDQLAELDILITGKLGTVEHKTLFECRDRKSRTSEGGEWIQQLVGRRQLLRLDTVVAVSTAGFSPGAVKQAKDANINLRTVEELTADDVKHFLPGTAPLVWREARFTDVKLVCIPENETMAMIQEEGEEHERVEFRTGDKQFRDNNTKEMVSLNDIWQKVKETYDSEIFGDVSLGTEVDKVIIAKNDIRNAYRCELGEKPGKIEELVFTAKVKVYPSQAPLVYCAAYGDQHLVARWIEDSGETIEVVLTKKEKTEAT